MTAKKNTENVDLEEIFPEEGIIEIDGHKCRVKRLKTREFFGLLRVMTSGLGPMLGQFQFHQKMSDEDMGAQLIAMAALALPNALEEFATFMQLIVEPVDSKVDIREALDNPDLDVTMEVIAVMIGQEAGDFRELVGKAQTIFSKMPGILAK